MEDFRGKIEVKSYATPIGTVNRTCNMICNANDLSPDQKAALETLLGCRVEDGEAVSHHRKLEIVNEPGNFFVSLRTREAPAQAIVHISEDRPRHRNPCSST